MTERTIMGHLTVDNYPMEGNRWIVPTSQLAFEAVIIGLDGPSAYPITGYLRKTDDKTLTQTGTWTNRGEPQILGWPKLLPPEEQVIVHRAWKAMIKGNNSSFTLLTSEHDLKNYRTHYKIVELVGHEKIPLK